MSLVLAACDPGETDPDVEDDPGAVEDTDADDVEAQPFGTYEMGMFEDMDAESYWAYLDDADVWSAYILAGSGAACVPYAITAPNYTVTPSLASDEWQPAEQDGDVWVVEFEIHEDVMWSDGEPITAADMEFTWNTVLEFPLGGQWITSYEPAELEAGMTQSIEAIDETTVRIEFTDEPGLASWPMQVGNAPIMPEHHWGPIVDEIDDVESFLAESGMNSPSCGPFVFDDREEGAFAAMARNDNYFLEGTEYTHYGDGTVEMVNEDLGIDGRFGESTGEDVDEVVTQYTVGPFAEEVIFTLYGDASVAVTALVEGEIPFLLTGPGIEEAAQDEIIDSPDVEAVINADYGMQYLGFNFDREPMDDIAFRQAVATVIDREYITDVVMGGSALPLYTRMPAGNEFWYDEERGDPLAEQWAGFEDQAERTMAAVEILSDAGYEWDTPPDVDDEGGVIPGEGITGPDGQEIDTIELAHPTAGYDPLRHTAGLFVSEFIENLGFDIDAQATEFGQLIDMTGDPDNLTYDMIILGWSLGNVALPTYYDSFWQSGSPVNNTGFSSDEYDEASAAFMGASTLDEARDILWDELEPILNEELPYVPLFDTPTVEGYRADEIRFPYTDVLGGIETQYGLPSTVMEAQ